MIKMKKYIYLLTIAALAAFGCTPMGPEEDASKEYAGNKAKVTLEDVIPVAGGSVTAVVKSEVPFTVSVPKAATWLTVGEITDTEVEAEVETEVDGVPVIETVMEPRKLIKFTAGENKSAEKRFASVALVDSEKNIVITRFDVTQEGAYVPVEKKDFGVSTNEINVEADVTTATFKVTGEVAWTITSSKEAFVVSPTSGEGEADVTVTFPANETAEAVSAEISVVTEDPGARPKSYTVAITQASAVKSFTVTTENNLSVAHTAFNVLFNIEGDVKWTATSTNEAFKFTDGDSEPGAVVEFEGNKNMFVVFAPNFTSTPLTTSVTFTTEDPLVETKTYSFEITQAGYQVVSQTILAEWIFLTAEGDKLKGNFNETTKKESNAAEGNGGFYVPNNGQGNGKIEYYNSNHKTDMQNSTMNRCKRVIGGSGEPCIYGTYVDDYMMYSAVSSTELPVGTKVHLFTVWRPKEPQVMKYWKAEYLDGTEWKPAGELKTATVEGVEVKYNVELDFAEGRLPHVQMNTYLDFIVELTVPTTEVKFRITSVVNAAAEGGAPVATPFGGSYVLRVAGGDSASASNFFLNVAKHHVIEVVQ